MVVHYFLNVFYNQSLKTDWFMCMKNIPCIFLTFIKTHKSHHIIRYSHPIHIIIRCLFGASHPSHHSHNAHKEWQRAGLGSVQTWAKHPVWRGKANLPKCVRWRDFSQKIRTRKFLSYVGESEDNHKYRTAPTTSNGIIIHRRKKSMGTIFNMNGNNIDGNWQYGILMGILWNSNSQYGDSVNNKWTC